MSTFGTNSYIRIQNALKVLGYPSPIYQVTNTDDALAMIAGALEDLYLKLEKKKCKKPKRKPSKKR